LQDCGEAATNDTRSGSDDAEWGIVWRMHVDDCSGLTDRQARAAIVAAEARGFLREPDLYEIWYHHLLHEDARYAVEHLRTHDPDALQEALIADECICPHCAALAITEASGFSLGQADLLVEAALERGFTPPSRACRSRTGRSGSIKAAPPRPTSGRKAPLSCGS